MTSKHIFLMITLGGHQRILMVGGHAAIMAGYLMTRTMKLKWIISSTTNTVMININLQAKNIQVGQAYSIKPYHLYVPCSIERFRITIALALNKVSSF